MKIEQIDGTIASPNSFHIEAKNEDNKGMLKVNIEGQEILLHLNKPISKELINAFDRLDKDKVVFKQKSKINW